jgi:iron complex outermembrane receptor protein
VSLDAQLAYTFGGKAQYSVILGAENIFDDFPDHNLYSGVIGAKYPESAPMGLAGGVYYLSFVYKI